MEAAIAKPDATAKHLAAAYGTLGQLYHAYSILDEAQMCYRNASRLEPGNSGWFHLMADASRRQGKLDDAVGQYEAAWALQPNDFAALVNLGEIYLELNHEDEAEAAYRSALSLYPGSPSVMAGLGQLALRRQQYEDAVAYFKAALVSVPDANRLHYSLAMAYRGLGRIDDAQRHLEQRGTVGIRPPDPLVNRLQQLTEGERVHLIRGRLAFASGRYEEAKAEFEASVEADPGSARALINLGTTLAELGESEEAIERFREALVIEPGNITAHFNLASLLIANGNHAAAIPHLVAVTSQAPYDGDAHLLLARSQVAVGNDLDSLPHFRQAAVVQPASEAAVVGGAAALVRLERFHQAKSVLDSGLERLPASGQIAFAAARLLAACPVAELRDGERALDLAQLVFEAEPSPRHAQVVAQALAELGRCEEAAQWQEQLVVAALEDGATDAAESLQTDLEWYRTEVPCRPPTR
jgi:tetratricopeptide (TPR) repeat protein